MLLIEESQEAFHENFLFGVDPFCTTLEIWFINSYARRLADLDFGLR